MIIDVHVHTSAFTPAHGSMSPPLLNSLAFRFMRWKLRIVGADERAERDIESRLVRSIDETERLDAAVVLAFDAVHDRDGRQDWANTHFYATNDYVIELAARHRKILFGASVHPYREDAIAELERCIRAGAVLCKWLPITQNFNPSDERCFPFYEALAHYKLPLLSHTGGENALPQLDKSLADPGLLVPALDRGVTVIMAHCGTRAAPGETDYTNTFVHLAKKYTNCYGDTSALNLPMRWHAYDSVLRDETVRRKLVHGSDWPIISLPPFKRLGMNAASELIQEPNWMRRDVQIKEKLGFDEAYWQRAATILRLPKAGPTRTPAKGF